MTTDSRCKLQYSCHHIARLDALYACCECVVELCIECAERHMADVISSHTLYMLKTPALSTNEFKDRVSYASEAWALSTNGNTINQMELFPTDLLNLNGDGIKSDSSERSDGVCNELKHKTLEIVEQSFGSLQFLNHADAIRTKRIVHHSDSEMIAACLEAVAKFQLDKAVSQHPVCQKFNELAMDKEGVENKKNLIDRHSTKDDLACLTIDTNSESIITSSNNHSKKCNDIGEIIKVRTSTETCDVEQDGFQERVHFKTINRVNLMTKCGQSNNFSGITCLADGRYFLADEKNCCILLLSQSFEFQDKLLFDSRAKPWNVARTNQHEIATTLRYEDDDYDQIAFIRVHKDKLKISRKVNLDYECFCIQLLSGGNLLVSARDYFGKWVLLEVTTKGKIRRKIGSIDGNKMDKIKRFAVLRSGGEGCDQVIYHVTCNNKTCVFKTIGLDGHQCCKFTYNSNELFQAGDFFLDSHENIYACNKIGTDTHILSNKGDLIGTTDNIYQPTCATMECESEIITVVTQNGSKSSISQFQALNNPPKTKKGN